ncbi:hypothetical protein GGI12_004976 [Dipsacomyces acuminosporus]|nr:hypothetical protein GGI12_004976 [Dipsacomyces acuminosporus]
MSHSDLEPATYIGIHERSPGLPILYVTSSVRKALLYEPEDFIGHSVQEYVADTGDGLEFKNHNSAVTEDNVLMANVFTKTKIGTTVYVKSIAFACDNVNFVMATSYPDITIAHRSGPLNVQRYKCILSEDAIQNEQQASDGGSSARAVDVNTVYSMRASFQACIVLEDSHSSENGETGSNIVFVTSSIGRILDVDSCDLQDEPFLSLVAEEDKERAAAFLERSRYSDDLVLEHLSLLVNPVEAGNSASAGSVAVELMAMGSDDGIIMLCQLARPRISQQADEDGYLSLADIISSDPETSDFPESWNRISA